MQVEVAKYRQRAPAATTPLLDGGSNGKPELARNPRNKAVA